MNYCNNCGKPIAAGASFCTACGRPAALSSGAVSATSVQPVQPDRRRFFPAWQIVLTLIGAIAMMFALYLFSAGAGHANQSNNTAAQQHKRNEPLKMKGAGDKLTYLTLSPGLWIFSAAHGGNRGFYVTLVAKQTGRHIFLFSQYAKYSGFTTANIPDAGPDGFILEVKADGEWEVDISEP